MGMSSERGPKTEAVGSGKGLWGQTCGQKGGERSQHHPAVHLPFLEVRDGVVLTVLSPAPGTRPAAGRGSVGTCWQHAGGDE